MIIYWKTSWSFFRWKDCVFGTCGSKNKWMKIGINLMRKLNLLLTLSRKRKKGVNNAWSKSDLEIRNAEAYVSSRTIFLNFIWSTVTSAYNIYYLLWIKLHTRLQLGIRHLLERKLRHNFAYSLSPSCSCSLETESKRNFFSMMPKLYYFTHSP